MNYTFIGFTLYLIIVLLVGFLTYRKNKSHNDFFLAGRKLNPWVVAFSERASGESVWILLGLPGAAMAFGLMTMWDALGCVLGIVFYWFVIAKDLRKESERVKAITIPNFFAQHLGKGGKLIRVVATLIIIFFFTFYLGAQFNGAGKILNVTFNIPQFWGVVIGTAVVIFYTMMGGFFAVAWTDLIQGIIMIGALVILPVVGVIELANDGYSLTDAVKAEGPDFASTVGGATGWVAVGVVVSGLSWFFGYMGQPHLLTRFMAIKDPGKIKISRRIAFAWAIPAFAGAMVIGLIGLSMYGKGSFEDVEQIMPTLATELLPAWLAGIFISGAIAAMMSTADSQLLVISSSVIEDFYHKTLGREVTEKTLLNLSRLVTIAVGIFGFLVAVTSGELIFDLVSYAWAGLGASFGPALLLMLKWKKIHWKGVLAGMITGSMVTIIWSEIDFLDEALSVRFVSFVLAFAVVVLVSMLANGKNESQRRRDAE
ncbi:MAG: sodium/proline symporter, partial [Bacteroidales bacterium]|nr:sodium/proline symporter [Bacteroidales bacterium]